MFRKAYSIMVFSLILIFVSTFSLTITEPDKSFLNLLFEEISAVGTVGLSTGVTPHLSEAGRIIIIISMFAGRVGTLSLAMTLSRQAVSTKFKYSKADIVVG